MKIYGAKSREEAIHANLIINTFCGYNECEQDYEEAYRLALECPCMKWFADAYSALNGSNDIYNVLIERAHYGCYYSHGLAMTFLSITNIPIEMTEIAAEHGCPLSQLFMHVKTKNDHWLQMAAAQEYPPALFSLKRFKEAAEWGYVRAMYYYARECKGQKRWYWYSKHYLLCKRYSPAEFTNHYRQYNESNLCQIGAIIPECTVARMAYLVHCGRVRKSIDTWSIVARRLGVCRDIRVLIAKIVWEKRVYRLK